MESQVDDQTGTSWAEVLQDGPLQGLAAMRLLLASAINHGSSQSLERAAAESMRQIDEEIATLRDVIAEMRAQLPDDRF
ncbi:MAG: hypothetical protein M3O25_02000 [Actinomycetota bacterium]|nr:hypothetical protein [Actinomycetota bacterium]